nr:elongation factor 1-delta 1-like [Tanacetum cinerariifolium]
MAPTFYVGSEAGLKKLDEFLLSRSYITGYQASKDDLAVHAAFSKAPSAAYVNVSRWFNHIEALLRISGVSAEGSGVVVEGSASFPEEAIATSRTFEMAPTFYVGSEAGLKKLDEYLLSRSYITGYQASKDDLAVHAAFSKAPSAAYVNVSRWFNHIEALLRISGVSAEGSGVVVEGSASFPEEAIATPPAAETKAADDEDDDSDVDLFGEETEEEKKAAEERAAAVKASGKKKELLSTIMRTKRKLLPKSDVDGSAQGNAPSENVNYVARHVCVPELCPNIYDPDCASTEGVRNDCENLERNRMGRLGVSTNTNISMPASPPFADDVGRLGVSPNTNISTPTSLSFADDVANLKRKRLCRMDDVGPSQPTHDVEELQAVTDMDDPRPKHKLSSIISLILSHNVPFVSADQRSPDDNCREQSPRVLSGIPSAYKSVGKCEYSCEHCGALFCNLRRDIAEGLIELLDTHNALVQLFRTAREKLVDTHVPNFRVRLYNVVGAHEYELPTGDMLGAIVYEPGPETQMDYDIVIEERSGYSQRVNKLHSSYMSLQFPLLFLYGEDGYSKDFKLVGDTGRSKTDMRLTMKAYYAYLIHDHFIREHQNDIRNEYLSGIYDAINRGDSDGSNCGAQLILPQSFTGGPRYMYSHYLDALAIFRVHGNPSFFITFTCNVKWPEITDYMADFPLLTPTDRADIGDRLFEMKV